MGLTVLQPAAKQDAIIAAAQNCLKTIFIFPYLNTIVCSPVFVTAEPLSSKLYINPFIAVKPGMMVLSKAPHVNLLKITRDMPFSIS
jgi:hypothetical protein